MATALDLITSAARLINVVASGETLPLSEANDGLFVLNDMIDSWNAQRLAIFTTRSEDFPLILGQQSYTMGPGGDFDTARPARIDAMSAILLYPDPNNPIEEPITMFSVQDWQTQVPIKKVNSSWPQICYDDGGFPLRTLNFWPIPNNQPNNKVRIYSWQALAAQTLAAQVSFPPGYKKALRYNLAVDLAAEFSAPVPAVVAAEAISSLAIVKSINCPPLQMRSDLIPFPAGYNYKADLFNIAF